MCVCVRARVCVCVCVCVYVCYLSSVSLPIYLVVYPSVWPSIRQSVYLYVYVLVYLSVCLLINQSFSQPIYLCIYYLWISLSTCVCLLVNQPGNHSIGFVSVYLSTYACFSDCPFLVDWAQNTKFLTCLVVHYTHNFYSRRQTTNLPGVAGCTWKLPRTRATQSKIYSYPPSMSFTSFSFGDTGRRWHPHSCWPYRTRAIVALLSKNLRTDPAYILLEDN